MFVGPFSRYSSPIALRPPPSLLPPCHPVVRSSVPSLIPFVMSFLLPSVRSLRLLCFFMPAVRPFCRYPVLRLFPLWLFLFVHLCHPSLPACLPPCLRFFCRLVCLYACVPACRSLFLFVASPVYPFFSICFLIYFVLPFLPYPFSVALHSFISVTCVFPLPSDVCLPLVQSFVRSVVRSLCRSFVLFVPSFAGSLDPYFVLFARLFRRPSVRSTYRFSLLVRSPCCIP